MDVIVIGGSLTGLMHGLMFKRLGRNVHILEQSASSIRENTAAGMSTGPNGKQFIESHDLDKRPFAFPAQGPHFVDKAGKVTKQLKIPLNLTSWDTLYYRLRANFDGLSSDYCPDPPPRSEKDGEAVYDLGKRVTAITFNGEFVTVAFQNLLNGGSGTCHANLVIAADGANSTSRELLSPQSQPTYVGYVAWRGTVPEAEVSEETREFFDKGLITNSLPDDHGYMVGYVMPGKNGTLERGHRDCNVVWYSKLTASSEAFKLALTDTAGHEHRSTLPKGMMQPKVWKRHLAESKKDMPPAFREVCEKVKQPFISTVNDCAAPKATYYNKKLLLVGEALMLIRPHTGISFDTAAFQVLQLEKALNGQITLDEWENLVASNNRKSELFALAYGRYFMYGALRPSFLLSMIRYVLFLIIGSIKGLLFRK